MNLKTFTATSMAAALAQVKRDLGSQAVILHTRSYRRGGFLGFGARTVVEITATDDPNVGKAARRPTPRRAAPAPKTPAPPPPQPLAGDLIRRTYAAARAQMAREQSAPRNTTTATVTPAGVDLQPLLPPALPSVPATQLAEEMRSVKRMVGRMMREQHTRRDTKGRFVAATNMPDKLFDQYLALLQQEVAEELAEEVVAQVQSALQEKAFDAGDETAVRRAVLDAVAKLIPTDVGTTAAARPADGRPRTIALIGPTGVGKTTTVAKLAANFKLKEKKRVALVTLDTYRIAAVDQLRTYANIIGVPLYVVTTPDEMLAAMKQCAGLDVVLIDTAGRSQRDDAKLEHLASFLRAANPHEVHLVLSSTGSQAVLMEAVDRFSALRTDRIIFTKLDEAVSFGVLLNVLRKVNKQLSYVTTGQEVPHQIEPGRPDRLAALVVGEG